MSLLAHQTETEKRAIFRIDVFCAFPPITRLSRLGWNFQKFCTAAAACRKSLHGEIFSPFGRIAQEKVAKKHWPDADTYILLSPINDKTCDDGSKKCNFYGVANGGWDYDHGVCSSRIERRVSINWFEEDTDRRDGYQEDDLLTALVCIYIKL